VLPQVSLYLLLLQQRYQLEQLPAGLLWNMGSSSNNNSNGSRSGSSGAMMSLVDWKAGELSLLMAHRNRVAAALAGDVPRPPPVLGVRGREVEGLAEALADSFC
jgi:hypothetical protein